MPVATESLRSLVQAELSDLVAIRHDLHTHPELSYQERRTAGLVANELARLGVEHKMGFASPTGMDGTGVVGHLRATTDQQRESIALRADMDALPIHEATGKPYASATDGVMHACGHDGHTTMLLGAARVLSKLDSRPSPVTFIFQPAEENGGGGERMCDEGALAGEGAGGLGPKASHIFGLHGWPDMPLGTVGSRPGPLLAATDDFELIVKGVGGHAAYPHLARDPIVAASKIVLALQTLASRASSPLDPLVVTVGKFTAGSADNIIPSEASLLGTVRTLSEHTRSLAKERFYEVTQNTARALGCEAEIHWKPGYPVTHNDPRATDRFFDIARDACGEDRVELVGEPSMGGEDFSYYGAHAKACFFLLGLRRADQEPGVVPRLHQPTFDFNDDAIATGVELLCRLALSD